MTTPTCFYCGETLSPFRATEGTCPECAMAEYAALHPDDPDGSIASSRYVDAMEVVENQRITRALGAAWRQ